jgi:hypothetical protein
MSWIEQSASCLIRDRLALEDGFRKERVWCVTSKTGNIITRRKGKVSVVGNTTGVDWDVRCIILARPTKSEILYTQIIGRGLRTAVGKEDCVARDTLVLTDRGEVKIQDVTLDHKVWDGVSFVCHGGAVCRGRRQVIEYCGVVATPEHRVMTEDGWQTIQEAARRQIGIARTGFAGRPIRFTADSFPPSRRGWVRSQSGGSVQTLRQEAHGSISQSAEAARHQSLSALQSQKAKNRAIVALSALSDAARSLREQTIDILSSLRWPWNTFQIQGCEYGGALGGPQSWYSIRS